MWSFVEAARVPSRLLGDLLVEDGLITADELEEALTAQAESGKRLGEVLVERKLVSGPELTAALMQQMGVEMSTQEGFGYGLFAEIKRRHRQARVADGGLPEPDAAGFEDAPRPSGEDNNLFMLDSLLEADEAAPDESPPSTPSRAPGRSDDVRDSGVRGQARRGRRGTDAGERVPRER